MEVSCDQNVFWFEGSVDQLFLVDHFHSRCYFVKQSQLLFHPQLLKPKLLPIQNEIFQVTWAQLSDYNDFHFDADASDLQKVIVQEFRLRQDFFKQPERYIL